MKLTKISELLMSFFIQNKCIIPTELSKKTEKILTNLFIEIRNAENYLNEVKKKEELNGSFYNLKVKEIHNFKDIPKPTTFASHGFPPDIRKYIDENITIELEYNIFLLNRKIKIYFLLEENDNLEIYNNYVDNILLWIILLNEYASKECAPQLTIYLYFTFLQKEIPNSNITILGESHANTAFTKTCPKNSEIVVYRKEEWFKVLIHETFHNFGLDFSDMNNEKCNNNILNIFSVNSEVNLYEAYAEFWAKIINILFCSYLHLKNKNNIEEFLTNCEFFINFELLYSCFQMVKVLDFMNMNYKHLYQKGKNNDIVRNTFYREKTNILAYYVITFILLNSYDNLIEWCNINNLSLLQFKKTTSNQLNFCNFIIQKHRSSKLLDKINCVEIFYKKLKSKMKKNIENKNKINYILNNLRMTICELG
jgi:hypothetical protein